MNLHDIPDDRNPEWPDPIPNESTVIAATIVAGATRDLERAEALDQLADNETENEAEYHRLRAEAAALRAGATAPPMTQQQREDLADEIEFDLL
jgi:hypothetical protein